MFTYFGGAETIKRQTERRLMAEKVKSKRAKDSGDSEDVSEGSTVSELLRYFLEERKEEKQRQEARDQQFLQMIESMAERRADEDKRREER